LARRRAQNRKAQRKFRRKYYRCKNPGMKGETRLTPRSYHPVRHRERKSQSNATQAEASQPQRLAARRPPSRTIIARTSPSFPKTFLPKTWGPCGLEIYGDINLIDFANLEDPLTPGPETEPTALPSPSQLTAILNIATSGSPNDPLSEHSYSGLADVTHSSKPGSLLSNDTNELQSSGAVSSGINPCEISNDTSLAATTLVGYIKS
jgi:hypothetical protein